MSAPALTNSVHSKSPWKIDGPFDAECGVTIQDADGIDICEYYPVTDEWSPEDIRNARLLAAAPAMFEILEDLLANRSIQATAIAALVDEVKKA